MSGFIMSDSLRKNVHDFLLTKSNYCGGDLNNNSYFLVIPEEYHEIVEKRIDNLDDNRWNYTSINDLKEKLTLDDGVDNIKRYNIEYSELDFDNPVNSLMKIKDINNSEEKEIVVKGDFIAHDKFLVYVGGGFNTHNLISTKTRQLFAGDKEVDNVTICRDQMISYHSKSVKLNDQPYLEVTIVTSRIIYTLKYSLERFIDKYIGTYPTDGHNEEGLLIAILETHCTIVE